MIYRRIAPLFAAISLSASAYTPLAVAANDSPQPQQWYQVEVLVFANNNPAAALDELWPEELGLKYPSKIVTLTEPLTAIVDEGEIASLGHEPLQLDGSDDHTASDAGSPLKAFVKLPSEQRQLNEEVTKVVGQYDFRPLFHQAWRQTIDQRDESVSIAITGGEAFDDHFELEGSIKISVERYLHIHTDLWLNRFVSNAGEQQPGWPLLPPVPRSLGEGDASHLEFALPATEQSSELDERIEMPPASDPLLGANQFLAQQLAQLKQQQYRVDKTIVLRQHRRMRSAELHYIDHPLFGVLIRIDPYTAPNEESDEQE